MDDFLEYTYCEIMKVISNKSGKVQKWNLKKWNIIVNSDTLKGKWVKELFWHRIFEREMS
jgi:hypothetical protein